METNLVFLCGFPSSGTDLLKNIVNAHSDVLIGGEFPFLPRLAQKYSHIVSAEIVEDVMTDIRKIDVYHNLERPKFDLTELKPNSEYSLSEIYRCMLSEDKVKWKGNKTPQNTENIDKLRILFPDAKFILIIRDIRDVALSWDKKWGKNKLLCAAKWNSRMQRGIELSKKLNDGDFLIVKYEDILDDLEEQTRKICDFLNIKYQENMIDFDKYVKNNIDGKLNYGKSLIRDNSQKWLEKLSKHEIKRIEEISLPSLKLFGYPISTATEYKAITKVEKFLGIVHDVYSLIFVGNRAIKSNPLSYRLKAILVAIKKIFAL